MAAPYRYFHKPLLNELITEVLVEQPLDLPGSAKYLEGVAHLEFTVSRGLKTAYQKYILNTVNLQKVL